MINELPVKDSAQKSSQYANATSTDDHKKQRNKSTHTQLPRSINVKCAYHSKTMDCYHDQHHRLSINCCNEDWVRGIRF
ncbi:hypothetical protein Q3G72_020540 [Acer saccharum]|nr:hypothetical protein Q3G72_020540 [Acer saccharum]